MSMISQLYTFSDICSRGRVQDLFILVVDNLYMDDYHKKWAMIKQDLDQSIEPPPVFSEREIWWVSIGQNIGREIYGKGERFSRPVLVIKKFSPLHFLGIPLSTKNREGLYYFQIILEEMVVSAAISQLRAYSSKRMMNRIGIVSRGVTSEVIEQIVGYLKTASPN